MTERASNNRHDGDSVRRSAYEEAMARLAGRRSLRHHMTRDSIQRVEQYSGPVVLGSLQQA